LGSYLDPSVLGEVALAGGEARVESHLIRGHDEVGWGIPLLFRLEVVGRSIVEEGYQYLEPPWKRKIYIGLSSEGSWCRLRQYCVCFDKCCLWRLRLWFVNVGVCYSADVDGVVVH
jgi:hypothetical protein